MNIPGFVPTVPVHTYKGRDYTPQSRHLVANSSSTRRKASFFFINYRHFFLLSSLKEASVRDDVGLKAVSTRLLSELSKKIEMDTFAVSL